MNMTTIDLSTEKVVTAGNRTSLIVTTEHYRLLFDILDQFEQIGLQVEDQTTHTKIALHRVAREYNHLFIPLVQRLIRMNCTVKVQTVFLRSQQKSIRKEYLSSDEGFWQVVESAMAR